MKKLLLSTIFIATSTLLIACDPGGMLDTNTRTVKADSVVRLSATGYDLRVYEFTPQTQPHMTCVFVAGERKGGVACFKKTF